MKWPWQKPPKKLVLCMVAPSATKRIAEELGEQRTFTVYPILYGDYDEIIDDCVECGADILAIEVAPDADDCDRVSPVPQRLCPCGTGSARSAGVGPD